MLKRSFCLSIPPVTMFIVISPPPSLGSVTVIRMFISTFVVYVRSKFLHEQTLTLIFDD